MGDGVMGMGRLGRQVKLSQSKLRGIGLGRCQWVGENNVRGKGGALSESHTRCKVGVQMKIPTLFKNTSDSATTLCKQKY